jgi:UrcA family protein
MKTPIKIKLNSTAAFLAASFFALACATIGSLAQAAEPAQALTKVVAYGDLNLDSAQGAKVLYARLRSAAQIVCSPLEGRGLIQNGLWQSCFDNAVSAAVGQVNKTTVSALHSQMINRSKS